MNLEYIYNPKQTDARETLWYLIEQLLDDADFDIKLWMWSPCQMCIIFHAKAEWLVARYKGILQGWCSSQNLELVSCFRPGLLVALENNVLLIDFSV